MEKEAKRMKIETVPLSSTTDTMENGAGYCIHMTSGDTWTYNGSAYTSMNVELKVNMIDRVTEQLERHQ